MPRVGFEPTISAGERPKTYALDRAATGTGKFINYPIKNYLIAYLTNPTQQSPKSLKLQQIITKLPEYFYNPNTHYVPPTLRPSTEEENCALLVYYAAGSGNVLPTFRSHVPGSRFWFLEP